MEESSDEAERQPQHPEHQEVESLRRKIKYFFMNPCEKYHARGRKPWKLMLQIIKIAIITIQVRTVRKNKTKTRDVKNKLPAVHAL